MKKIIFNDNYGLTTAVLNGSKTMDRQIFKAEVYGELTIESNPTRIDEHRYGVNSHSIRSHFPKYKVGEIVAVAQCYDEIFSEMMSSKYDFDIYEEYRQRAMGVDLAGNANKMFVKADLMPHQICFTDVYCEQLQDISDDECLKEGIWKYTDVGFKGDTYWYHGLCNSNFRSPREAYAALIDKLHGKGTWESNPYVFVYEFKLEI